MKVFFDTEFTGLHKNTTLISLGVVSEDGTEFYAEFTDYDIYQCDEWIVAHVLPKLDLRAPYAVHGKRTEIRSDTEIIARSLQAWLEAFGERVEMWSDCLAYDWVLFCHMFGGAMALPECVYYIPFDLSTLLWVKGIDPDINREEFAGEAVGMAKHHALWDANIVKQCYEKLVE